MIRTATCRCGACVVELKGDPVSNQLCHCSYCKRRSGTAFGWSAVFLARQVVSCTGDFTVYTSNGNVGRADNAFCNVCGTTLTATLPDMPAIFWVAGGCFVDPPLPEPTVSNSDDQRCAWLTLPAAWQIRTSAMADGGPKPV